VKGKCGVYNTLYSVPLWMYFLGPRQLVAELNVSFYNKTHSMTS